MPSVAAHPVRTLREHATALEAALTVCLAAPDKRAVHKLRTETRRMEALIAFMKLLRGLPPFRAAAGKLLRQSAKVRRAAGRVRDLDVQHKLIEEEAESVARSADDPTTVRSRFESFLSSHDEDRARAANKLTKVLRKRQTRIARTLEQLLEALEPAMARTVTATEMIALVSTAFRATPELRYKQPTEEDLHTIRKAAKRARYQLETAPDAKTVRAAAKRFEALQDAGGRWHDWLELTHLAARDLGEHHRITAAFSAERDRCLRGYGKLLEETRTRMAAAQAKNAARKSPAKSR